MFESEGLICSIRSYRSGHSLLLIDITDSDVSRYIVFETVIYFEGPIAWKGANFSLGERDECKQLLQKTQVKDILIALSKFKLYLGGVPSPQVRIIATGFNIFEKIPENFYWLQKRENANS